MLRKISIIVVFVLAAIILVLGIAQLSLYLGPQLQILALAPMQGATEAQIAEYYSGTIMPQVITYVIGFLGFVSVLVACGLILMQLPKKEDAAFSEEDQEGEADAEGVTDQDPDPAEGESGRFAPDAGKTPIQADASKKDKEADAEDPK